MGPTFSLSDSACPGGQANVTQAWSSDGQGTLGKKNHFCCFLSLAMPLLMGRKARELKKWRLLQRQEPVSQQGC